MRSRLIVSVVATIVVLVAGLVTWHLTAGRSGPVTAGACRVPAGPLAVVVAASRNAPQRAPEGETGKAVDYEVAHAEAARSLSVVDVDGDSTAGAGTINLTIGGGFTGRNVSQMFERMSNYVPAPATQAGALTGLRAGAAAVRETGSPGTVVLWDPAHTFDLGSGKAGKPFDLSGLTVVVAGKGDAAQRWVPIARAAGAACADITGTDDQARLRRSRPPTRGGRRRGSGCAGTGCR